MKTTPSLVLCLLLLAAARYRSAFAASADPLDEYNVVWETPSRGPSGSMPVGNGDIGLNVWVEEGGDLLFYIAKTDAWSENIRLLKLGRVRVKLSPNPFGKALPFRQALRLRQGEIEIQAGRGESETMLRIWVRFAPLRLIRAFPVAPWRENARL